MRRFCHVPFRTELTAVGEAPASEARS